MRVKALFAFNSKLFRPCKKLLLFFRFKLKKPVFIRALRLPSLPKNSKTAPSRKRISSGLISKFCFHQQPRKMDSLAQLKSVSEEEREGMVLPSRPTPAYFEINRTFRRETFVNRDVADACRSFENYLVEMMIEEGKVRDLMDVEELLYCWKNLKCPVFIALVGSFYGELCKDLFSPE